MGWRWAGKGHGGGNSNRSNLTNVGEVGKEAMHGLLALNLWWGCVIYKGQLPMNLPSNLALGGSLEAMPQRHMIVAWRRAKWSRWRSQLDLCQKVRIEKRSAIIVLEYVMCCTVIYLSLPAPL